MRGRRSGWRGGWRDGRAEWRGACGRRRVRGSVSRLRFRVIRGAGGVARVRRGGGAHGGGVGSLGLQLPPQPVRQCCCPMQARGHPRRHRNCRRGIELREGDEFKRSGQLPAEAVGAIEGAGGAVGAAPKPMGSSNIWARSEGSVGGAVGDAVGAADGPARVGGSAGVVAGSGGWSRPGTAVVIGVEGRHAAEVGAQACLPPRPLVGSGVNPALYLAFSASGSAFQRWPGA